MFKKISCVIVGLFLATLAFADTYPSKPITIVVPFPAGGSTDSIARAISPKMTADLGQPIVIDNKPGATGSIGAMAVKRAPADGYTFMVSSIGVYATNPYLQKNIQYDPVQDFDLLTVAVRAPNVLLVSSAVPAKDIKSFMEYLKKNPSKVTFATSGAGSSDHLTTILFWQKTGTSGLHVPYKGGSPAITDLLGSQVDASFQNLNVVINHVKSGKLKALAITGEKRSPLLPNVPTLAESGIKDVDVYSWQGIAAPKGLSAEVKKRLHASIVKALNAPDVKKNLTDVGL